MDWKEFFVKAGLEEELSKEYGKKCDENRYGFCDKYRPIFPTCFNFAGFTVPYINAYTNVYF